MMIIKDIKTLAALLMAGVAFTASGYRVDNTGKLNNVGTYGYYWSATTDGESIAREFLRSLFWSITKNIIRN